MKCPNCGSTALTAVDATHMQCTFCLNTIDTQASAIQDSPKETAHALDFTDLFNHIVRLKLANAQATGFVIHPKGYILTNAHVVKDTPIIEGVRGSHPRLLELETYSDGSVMDVDLAVLKTVEEANMPPVKWASNQPKVGDDVYVLGNPRNLGLSVNKGTIAQMNAHELQLNMTLNPGNSGGPVINQRGEVIGVVSYLLEDVQGMAFAVRLETVQSFIKKSFENR